MKEMYKKTIVIFKNRYRGICSIMLCNFNGVLLAWEFAGNLLPVQNKAIMRIIKTTQMKCDFIAERQVSQNLTIESIFSLNDVLAKSWETLGTWRIWMVEYFQIVSQIFGLAFPETPFCSWKQEKLKWRELRKIFKLCHTCRL